MKKGLISLVLIMLLISSVCYASTGFVDNRNATARLYNGFYEEDAYLVMKWSKDWIPQAHQKEGAWLSNHWTWYADDYDEASFYGYNDRTPFNTGKYQIIETIKMKAIDDSLLGNPELTYIWGNIVIMTDCIEIYDAATGELVETIDVTPKTFSGYGNHKFQP